MAWPKLIVILRKITQGNWIIGLGYQQNFICRFDCTMKSMKLFIRETSFRANLEFFHIQFSLSLKSPTISPVWQSHVPLRCLTLARSSQCPHPRAPPWPAAGHSSCAPSTPSGPRKSSRSGQSRRTQRCRTRASSPRAAPQCPLCAPRSWWSPQSRPATPRARSVRQWTGSHSSHSKWPSPRPPPSLRIFLENIQIKFHY